ncbi:hypothetical protein G4D63_11290 [Bacillus mesophilus]|uniref:LPXTG cell wall anchor domain-containing protein n=1 Tax=Bacillus mesophilus TaxID=1808955 RepID=A0A6M0Q9X5_9BACI|nr:hypothetical protein [Bacillus mesophilus]NEY72310.1 hypothetical protein [Bacillus mesophilus]
MDPPTDPVDAPADPVTPDEPTEQEEPDTTPVSKTISGGQMPDTASNWLNLLLISGTILIGSSIPLLIGLRRNG